MSCYVMNYEELFFQGLSANEMTQPLSAIICVAIFPVNFPLQEKSCILLQPFVSLLNSRYVTNFESLLLKEYPPNDMTKPLNAIIFSKRSTNHIVGKAHGDRFNFTIMLEALQQAIN